MTALLQLLRPTPTVRIVAESEWGHVAVFTPEDFPAARALGWQLLGTVTSGASAAPARHARSAA